LVTVEPARTEKLAADPKPTDGVAPSAEVAETRQKSTPVASDATRTRDLRRTVLRGLLAAEEPLRGDTSICGAPWFTGAS
jgi:hypothetical protein